MATFNRVLARAAKFVEKDKARRSAAGNIRFRFKDEKTRLRVLPAANGDDEANFFLYVGLHYNVPGQRQPVVCPNVTEYREDSCPICEMVAKLRAEGKNEQANKLSVRRRYFFRALVRGEEGVHMVDSPSTVFSAMIDILSEYEDAMDIKSGYDFIVKKKGSGLDTSYTVIPAPKPSPLLKQKQAAMEIIDSLTPIHDTIVIPTTEDVANILGYGSDDEEEEEEFNSSEGDDWGDDNADDDSEADDSGEDEDEWGDEDEEEDDVPFEEDDVIDDEEEDTPVSKVSTARDRIRRTMKDKDTATQSRKKKTRK